MSDWLLQHLLLAVPLMLLLAGWWCGFKQRNHQTVAYQALIISGVVTILTFAGIISQLFFVTDKDTAQLINQQPLNLTMLSLVVIMAWVLLKFSQNYMAGEQRLSHYYRWILITLGAVALTVIIDHLLIFWMGWLLISLALHQLLTFYPERPRAILASHKKFIIARIAELSLLVAITLLYLQHNTFSISELLVVLQQNRMADVALSTMEQLAALSIAITALLKCAQLPIHGWLIQVVESPTPVSALLHAGVINLGGFLLILFAPLFIQAILAQWLVLVVAGLSTVVCALIMTTRISYKVRLAWSTSAQMGLMLLECALGMFELALLHLLAHSAYKAYAFLNSGHAVFEDLNQRLSPQTLPPIKDWIFAGTAAALLIIGVAYFSGYRGPVAVWLIFAFALALLLIQQPRAHYKLPLLAVLITAIIVVFSYTVQKMYFIHQIVNFAGFQVTAFSAPDLWVMLMFTLLFVVHLLRFYHSHWLPIQRISLTLYAGLYLDEWFTRMTLRIWPVQLPLGVIKNRYNSTVNTEQ